MKLYIRHYDYKNHTADGQRINCEDIFLRNSDIMNNILDKVEIYEKTNN